MPKLDFSAGRRSQYKVSPIFEEEPPVDHISPAKKKCNNEYTAVPYEEPTPTLNTMKMR